MKKFFKAYKSVSALIVAILVSYITVILTDFIAPPKQLLCKFSVGYCPSPVTISFGATDIDKIVDRDGVGQGVNENQIGMLHNKTVPNQPRSNMVKYKFDAVSDSFKFRIYYAAGISRPVKIVLNDVEIHSEALTNTTGGWDNKDRSWSQWYKVTLRAKDNTLMIKRDNVFPHLSKFEFVQDTQEKKQPSS